MGELGAFLKVHRVGFDKRDPKLRVGDYEQYFGLQPAEELRRQGARDAWIAASRSAMRAARSGT